MNIGDSRLPQRYWDKIQVCEETGCWLWTASIDRYGYGTFKVSGRTTRAHRVSYTVLIGDIPEGLELDHSCRVRHCVNPAHLEPVTYLENQLRSPLTFAGKSACSANPGLATAYNQGVRNDNTRKYQRERMRAYRAAKKNNLTGRNATTVGV